MKSNTPQVVHSNQAAPHSRLQKIVSRHLQSRFLKPYADHNKIAFDKTLDAIKHHRGPLIFDSFCGVGESSAHLARQHPHAFIIGIDKSLHRLSKHDTQYKLHQLDNYYLVRADVDDFWRLAADAKLTLEKHFLLYPNPWPKSSHLSRRCHGSPLFPTLIKLGGTLELRSNWLIYIQEFNQALGIAGKNSQIDEFFPSTAITPFERKYLLAQHKLWRCVCELNKQV